MVYTGSIEWFCITENDSEYGKQPCEVKIDEKKIEVWAPATNSYLQITYRGNEIEPGHYELWEDSCNTKSPQATLHRFKGSNCFEGYYEYEDEKGMWRITLGNKKGKKV